MKYLITILFIIYGQFVYGQTNYKTVMSDTNGVVQRPTNFWTANSNSINSVISNSSLTFNAVELAYKIRQSFFVNPAIETSGGSVLISNSFLKLSILETNTNAIASIRLLGSVNQNGPSGVGTLFGSHSHRAWVQLDSVTRQNGFVRFVLGSPESSTNIAQYPTNRFVGFELRSIGGGNTNEIRLVAHNGTTNTNGPWTTIGTIFQKYTIGVEQNKTNGQVRLWVGSGVVNPTLNTNATISGGPTNNAGFAQSGLDIGLFTTNTNSLSIGANVFSALVEIID